MALAVVRDLQEHRVPATEGELADFETDVLAGFVLPRASAGLVDSTIRNDTNHLELIRADGVLRVPRAATQGRTAQPHRPCHRVPTRRDQPAKGLGRPAAAHPADHRRSRAVVRRVARGAGHLSGTGRRGRRSPATGQGCSPRWHNNYPTAGSGHRSPRPRTPWRRRRGGHRTNTSNGPPTGARCGGWPRPC